MTLLMKFVRNFTYSNYRSKVTFLNTAKHVLHKREFHNNNASLFTKTYLEYENRYAYNILVNKGYTITSEPDFPNAPITHEEFQDILKSNWSKKTPSEIFEVFYRLADYCSSNNLSITDTMFDMYIDNFTDNIKLASEDELELIFKALIKWPDPESIRSRNHIEVWVALDDECLNRMKEWSYDKLLHYASLFYKLNAIKFSDYCIKCMNKLASKVKQLTPCQVVHTMFFIGVSRKQPFDMHNIELYINDNFSKFSIDDIAVMSMGFFKSKTPIRDMNLVLKIINLVIANAKDVHEVSLAAILKQIRYSTRITIDDRIYRLQDALQDEVSRLSIMCNVHIALVGTATLTRHKECATKIAETTMKCMSQARVKDLERLVLTFGTFNFRPLTNECFLTKVVDELKKPEREEELLSHGRSFACCIAYFGLLGIYPQDLIKKVMSPQFLQHTYGKQSYNYGREILTLHNTSRIFCPDADIEFLSDKNVKILAKKYTDYVPSETYKKQYNVTETMMLDVLKVLSEIRGGNEYVLADHILSHHQRGDVIICNKEDGSPDEVQDAYKDVDFGLIKRPPNNNTWVVLVIAGRNAMIYDSHEATGHFSTKIRELKALGYNATLVPWSIYKQLETFQEKANFLNRLIDEAIKVKNNKM